MKTPGPYTFVPIMSAPTITQSARSNNDWIDIFAICASTVALSFSGMAGVLAFYALWLPRLLKGSAVLPAMRDLLFPVTIVGYAGLSVLWSDYPAQSARCAVELASMMLCVSIIARCASVHSMTLGLLSGAALTLSIALLQPDSRIELSGILTALGSKNQVGALAELGILCAGVTWHLMKRVPARVMFSLLPMVSFLGVLYLSHSATSTVTLIGAIAVIGGLSTIARFPRQARMSLLFLAFCFCVVAGGLGAVFDLKKIGLEAIGKDETLTGRTFLWDQAAAVIAANPLGGVGYGAFWVHGNPLAERLWYHFDIKFREGFHFHNLFINAAVEWGLIGCALWIALYARTWIVAVRRLLAEGNNRDAAFYVVIVTMYLLRASSEVDTTGPYSLPTLVFFYAAMRVRPRPLKAASVPLIGPLRGQPNAENFLLGDRFNE